MLSSASALLKSTGMDDVEFRLEVASIVEAKMLVLPGEKQLREDFDQRVGLLS